jgi:4-amino-4-deoxy-L-arabinose transferase-like glycosyltransferase
MRARIVFFALSLLAVVVPHIGWLDLPLHWDEMGYFIPAALDLHRGGHWIPASTTPSPHPPGLPAYLAAVWALTGYSIPVTRVAMLALGAVVAFLTFLLAVRLCRDSEGVPAFWAALFLLVSPLFYTQSLMAQLDLPAALFTVLALLLFVEDRIAGAAAACCGLVLMKETGVVVPLLLAGWLVRERRYRQAAWYVAPAAALGAWLVAVHSATGSWSGARAFAAYNLEYPLHPFRVAAGLVRRLYALGVADLQWLGTLAIAAAWRNRLFADRAWKVVASFVAAHLALVSALGGAHLERYLLPTWPLFYIAAARAFAALGGWKRTLAPAAMACGLLAGLFVNPPYPFPYENNLAMTSFVELHRRAAAMLERNYLGARITTAWPLSAALRRPEFGYVRGPLAVRELPDFSPASFGGIDDVELLVLYSREWEPRFNWMRVGWVEALWRRYFGHQRPIDGDECRRRFGLRRVARWESRGQWIEVLAGSTTPKRDRAGLEHGSTLARKSRDHAPEPGEALVVR